MTKANQKTTVFVSGNFFALHPGHVRLLKFAAECGNRLVVGVSALRQSSEVPSPAERAEALRELGIVDEVVVLDEGVEAFIRQLRPDVVVKGKEFETAQNIEAPILKEYGGQLIFSSGESTYSATDLLTRDNDDARLQLTSPDDFIRRHALTKKNVCRRINDFAKLNVIVVGDLIIDEYIMCEALGMSREDPTLVVSPQSHTRYIGGAGIVASHAAALGASVRYFSIVGDDSVGEDANARLRDMKVNATLFTDASRPTTLKQRYRAQDKTLLRVSHLRQHEIGLDLQDQVFTAFDDACRSAQLVIFSDFSYGALPQRLVDRMTEAARAHGVMTAADSQSSSQVGDISRFRNAMLLSPTEFEARLAMRDQTNGLAKLGYDLLASAQSANAFIKLGAAGVLMVSAKTATHDENTDRLPALNKIPKDVSGAGDSMLTAGALALASGASIWEAGYLGSVAAGIQTSRIGNIPITAAELTDAINA
jgi:rfaE bifunctional protein kinase chain/domain